MVLCSPWTDSNLNNWTNTPFLDHQTLINFNLETVIFVQKNNLRISRNELFPMMFTNQCICSVLLLPLIQIMEIEINRKNLGWSTWSQPINWWWQVKPHNCHHNHDLPQTCGKKIRMSGLDMFHKQFVIKPKDKF